MIQLLEKEQLSVIIQVFGTSMEIKKFLCCFTTREGSFMCGAGSLIIGCLRIYLQWFNIEFLHRLTKAQIKDLPLSMTTLQKLSILETSISAVALFVTVLLLVGLCKRKTSLLIPWIVWVCIEELLDVCSLVVYAAKHIQLSHSVYIGDAVFFIINMYCVFCVHSYRKDLKREIALKKIMRQGRRSNEEDSDEEMLLPGPV
ncbi:uncharacterized protein LOC116604566 isoform X2 [Nematostella vectensis]|uniref:uncharacterized protein LOC116604566 isoform X2 n=1 Tax=Nematostella vectensis TaxID=45351 RepID=UPI001390577D|nr:uncharacterized protein LOC116604566 isoform X2 [Nematostella vectensis]